MNYLFQYLEDILLLIPIHSIPLLYPIFATLVQYFLVCHLVLEHIQPTMVHKTILEITRFLDVLTTDNNN